MGSKRRLWQGPKRRKVYIRKQNPERKNYYRSVDLIIGPMLSFFGTGNFDVPNVASEATNLIAQYLY
jgi:hypothetical protein